MPSRQAKIDVPLKAAAKLPERAVYMAKDGELVVSVSLNRKDSTLVIKAETDSIVPIVTVKSMETVARKITDSEREEKPPDKTSWWERVLFDYSFLTFPLMFWMYYMLIVYGWRIIKKLLETIKKLFKYG